MKLSTLIAYRNLLEDYRPSNTASTVTETAGHSLHVVQEHQLQFSGLTDQLTAAYQDINRAFADYNSVIDEILVQIDQAVEDLAPGYFQQSYKLYEQEYSTDQTEYILDRKLYISDEARLYIQARIKHYGDWHYAGMILRPGQEDWIHELVACDPLYLLDQDPKLLRPALERFNSLYQNRLRSYTIHREQETPLHIIPDAQIGFCLVYNFFHYKPFEILRSYLADIFAKLRPGGTLGFTFNDCDRAGAVELVERYFMCYTPGHLVLALCESLGYEILQSYHIDSACTWVEIRKPGELSSLRGGQNLAEIIGKSK